ncbi:hypothetical protein K0A96_00580 [Patescibacteria group bacterium]|nr:hypothetical protein [Patescibacteria group bacterium]
MSTTKNKASIEEFLSVMIGSKEVGLVIAKNEAEISSFSKAMDGLDFKRSENISDLFKATKTYLVADENIDKDVYDFIVQYPTGQVEIFNKKLMQSQTLSPDYKNSAIVLLVEKNNLNKIQEKGFDILGVAGPAFQA